MRFLRKVGREIGKQLLVALLIYVLVSVGYNVSWSHVEASPLYNSSETEMKALLIYIPIISIVSSLLLRIFFLYIDREVFMSLDERARRRMHSTKLEVGREMRERR